MAPRSSKRTATRPPAEEPGAKRVADFLKQRGISKASYQPVREAVLHPFTGLSEGTRQMVLAILPWSIAVPADERHAAQEAAVHMVGEIVEAVQAELRKAVAVEADKVDELRVMMAEFEVAVQRTADADAEARQAVHDGSQLLAQAEAAVLEKRAAMRDIEAEQTRLRAEIEQTSAQSSELEKAIVEDFASLRDRSFEDSEAEGLVRKVMTVSAKFSLEQSLTMALPGTLVKRERGAFDEVVIGQAEQSLRGKLDSMGAVVAAASAQLAAHVASLQVAQCELEKALADQTQAADTLRGAQDSQSQGKVSEEAAKCDLAQIESKLAAATAVFHTKCGELEQFCAYNVCIFNLLRDRVQKQTHESAVGPVVHMDGGSATIADDVMADAAGEKETRESVEDSVACMAGKKANIAAPNREPAALQGAETASLAGA